MKNLSKKKLGILAALLAIALSGLAIANPFKITDPSDPRFDPMEFRFEDYTNTQAKMNALRLMFPNGTSEKKVQEILIKHGGAREVDGNLSNVKHYMYKPWYPTIDGWNITIHYSENRGVQKILMNGFDVTKPLYPNKGK